ncbi:signal peptidase I [Sinomonas mesophila]|uniref:signal peptidase I n=1 Tax=Sinomonas mesophila TaxID=1531955 RepID=UPI001FE877CF|nr:signal peptidase I [Sinomonas mesophila]
MPTAVSTDMSVLDEAVTETPGAAQPARVPSRGREARRSDLRLLLASARVLGRAALGLAVGVALAAFLFLAVGPRVLGYQTSTMLTGSMAPMINSGDVVVSVRTPTSQLKVGDVLTYHIPVGDQRVETHRVIEVTRPGDGTTLVRTRGDANNGLDPWTAVITDNAVYTTAAVVPHLGDAIRFLRQGGVSTALMYAAAAAFVAVALHSIWRREARPARTESG